MAVTNLSATTWPGRGAIALSYHWRRSDGAVLPLDGDRARLGKRLEPGQSVRLQCRLTAPTMPGRYVVELDLVHGPETWFAHAGSEVTRQDVVVTGQPEAMGDVDYQRAYAVANLDQDYWSVVGPGSEDEFRRLGQAKLEMLKGLGLTPASRVLDVGCGTGSLTEAMAGFLESEGLYFGTDISNVAVQFCRGKYKQPNFAFAQNQMTTLPFEERRFDYIVFFSVFTHTYPDESAALLAEASRLLGDEGVIVADAFESSQDEESYGQRAMVVLKRGRLTSEAIALGLETATIHEFAWDHEGARPIDRVMRRFSKRETGPDSLPIPPRPVRFLVANPKETVDDFFHIGQFCVRRIREELSKHGIELTRLGSVLDFGCGCGRTLRHLVPLNGPRLHGTDYNPVLIEWCRQNLPGATFGINQLAPPLQYADEQFDLVYALSVFTHLPEALARLWMRELARILKPGGYLLFTSMPERLLPKGDEEALKRLRRGEPVVVGSAVAGTNDCSTWFPATYVQQTLAPEFEILDFQPEGMGQDLWLLRKPLAPSS